MSKKWSSFGEQQLLTENWRKFLTEEVVELEESEEEIQERFRGPGGYVDRFKQSSKAFADKWKETRPVPMEDYPATELTTILNMIYQEAGLGKSDEDRATRDEIVKEFETMLKAQNFVVKEEINGGELILGQKLVLDLKQTPTLARVLEQIKTKNLDAYNRIMSAFQRGGFEIGDVPVAQQKQAQSAAQQNQTQQTADQQSQSQAAAPSDELTNSYPAPEETDGWTTSLPPLSTQDSIKMTADTARAQDLDAYSGDAAATQDAEKDDRPADQSAVDKKPENEKKSQSMEEIVKSELRKGFDGTDEELDEAFGLFIDDLRKLKNLKNEVGDEAAKSSMGIAPKQFRELKQKHEKIFAAIKSAYNPYNRKNREARQRFLDALTAVATTGSQEYYNRKSDDALRALAGSDSYSKPSTNNRETEDGTDSKKEFTFPDIRNPRVAYNAKNKSYSKGKKGNRGIIRGSNFSIDTNKRFQDKETALMSWKKLHKFYLAEKEKSKRSRTVATPDAMPEQELKKIQDYLVGLQEWIESYSKETVSETLNESTMLRWKELAGIL